MSPKPVSPVLRWAVYLTTLAVAILIGLGLATFAMAQTVAPPGQCVPVDYPPGWTCTPPLNPAPPAPAPPVIHKPHPTPLLAEAEPIPALGPIALLLLAGAAAALPWVRRR